MHMSTIGPAINTHTVSCTDSICVGVHHVVLITVISMTYVGSYLKSLKPFNSRNTESEKNLT